VSENEETITKEKNQKVKSSTTDLRIREDIAKYLRNLDENSAAYDPKSRSMKENPNPDGRDDY